MLLILLPSIAAPGIFFGYWSLRRMDAKFHDDTLGRMRYHSREIGMAIHGGLISADQHAAFLAAALGSGGSDAARSPAGGKWVSGTGFLLGATRFRDGRTPEALHGDPCPAPPVDRHALAHLSNGKGMLYLGRGPDSRRRAFIARAVPGASPERELLSFEVDLEPIWVRVRNAVPPVSEIVVLSTDGADLFHTRPPPAGLLERIGRARGEGVAGNFVWRVDSDELLVDHASIFLKPAFHAGNWTAALVKTRSETFAASSQFSRVLFMSVALVVLAAGLVALVQFRRSIAPLEVLKDGTRRISEGDFDSRIVIGSGDEFEDLARSFNAMADHLGREFRTQAEMGRVIQSILGETDRDRIVRTLLDEVGSVIPCDRAGVALLDAREGNRAAIVRIRGESSEEPPGAGEDAMLLCPEEIARLKASATSITGRPGGDFDRFLSQWPLPRPSVFLLAPLAAHGELTGVVLLGYDAEAPDMAPEIPSRLRQVADQTAIALSRARLLEELNENDLGTLQALSRAVDANSPWTAGHSQRVTALAMEIGRDLGLPEREIDTLHRGGMLHDIGKLGIPPEILDKPGRLTDEEYAVIKRHPSTGAEILRPIPTLAKVVPIVSQHHERFDGAGYPLGLSGDAISLHARILAVADVVDALSSDRPYRAGWPKRQVISFAQENSGTHFDPAVVRSLLRIVESEAGESLISGYSEPSLLGQANQA